MIPPRFSSKFSFFLLENMSSSICVCYVNHLYSDFQLPNGLTLDTFNNNNHKNLDNWKINYVTCLVTISLGIL